MDPWRPCSVNNPSGTGESQEETETIQNKPDVVGLAELHKSQTEEKERNSVSSGQNSNQSEVEHDDLILTFGDNFQPFVKLPDSKEYLESLERKLKLIQKGGRKGPTSDSILRSLGQTKESCMIKLLSNSVEKLTVEGELFEELRVNPILKKIAPERQALSAEELVHLLKADQLEILLGNNNSEDVSSSSQEIPEDLKASSEQEEIDSKSSSICVEKEVSSEDSAHETGSSSSK